jgi:5-methylcytosine-specific restriction endonuclease McrA
MSLTKRQKQRVRDRAGNCCEYCRVSQASRLTRFQIDHIIAIAHGGSDENDNLCLSCYPCNAFKGTNIAAIDPQTGNATRLFNPRLQEWNDHFRLNNDATINGITPEGRTTVAVLRMNDSKRAKQRLDEIATDDYPCKKA